VYPQKADFTFYGGIYRDVKVISVPKAHFALDYHGGSALMVTPKMHGIGWGADLAVREHAAEVTMEAWVNGAADAVTFTISDAEGNVCLTQRADVKDGAAKAVLTLENPHLWDGVKDPYLYTAKAELENGGTKVGEGDVVEAAFGCRFLGFDAEKGFYLNGRPYRLCGAARHQDRQGVGYAITKEMHEEDLAIMREMGANTVRLAHYQHAQYFYDLCDKAGMIVWAEIPYITAHMEGGRENTVSQMTELVIQNYNHPSIICWGLSNEITAGGGVTDEIVENHRILNDLCHKLDETRPTTMAHAFMLDANHPFVMASDIRSYNLYYGWYIGEKEQNDEWFDDFHAAHPQAVIGLSEYGADANPAYQSGKPEKGDWTENYQAVYHEHLLKMWSERPYIWAMHCWNMFDFGADGRDEGGKPGQNQKGLVTFDRKTKKDAFYIYKAYLSDDPFVHVCGRRYVDRAEEVTDITVYSNQSQVTLYVDGAELETKGCDKACRFEVKIFGEHEITAKSGELEDTIRIRKVEKPNSDYVKEGGEVVNWFDKPEELVREGYYSIMDTMEDLKKNPQAAALLGKIMAKARGSYGEVAQGVEMPEAIQRQMDKMPLNKMLKQVAKAIGPDVVKELNGALNKIKKDM
jgi:beta-galactosidase